MITNDFVIQVATVNGSGSQSSNSVLVKSLFRMGISVSGKNMFPSNIAGLPTWFTIRLSRKSFSGRKSGNDIVVGMNLNTIKQDIDSVKPGGYFIYNSDLKFDPILLRQDVENIGIPFKSISKDLSDSIKLKKLLVNMVYAGVVSQLIDIPEEIIAGVIADQFADKNEVIESNLKAIKAGREYARKQLNPSEFLLKAEPVKNGNTGKILIDGNTATALGLIYGGCSFLSWYPITPSSSISETFEHYAKKLRVDESGRHNYAIVQAEDELSAISMVIGAGWAGSRAITCTSGPGLSLMAEAAGLSYFAEVPAVIWDVQRGGPSTGLPTRTQQADVGFAAHLSHGDTEHILLLPNSPHECFEFGQTCFDLAETLQTLVIVLSDLDLGMNLWVSDELKPTGRPFHRGKVLSETDLDHRDSFERYADVDGDAIPYRTLPGTHHKKAGYFTRGTGHKPDAGYSEDHIVYRDLLKRLKKKFDTAKKYVPRPEIKWNEKANIGIIAFGSTDSIIEETQYLLNMKQKSSSYMRLRAYPFTEEVNDFIDRHDKLYVVEQNRDGQMHSLLVKNRPDAWNKLSSIVQYDGLPIEAEHVYKEIMLKEGAL
ncbi:MAG: 2-oxoacid:acceptor oxidoreductase subunit alpha [Bdellovibrionales bacterium]